MNWQTIDHTTQATEIPDAGCFVMFFKRDIVFAPGVKIAKDKAGKLSLVASDIYTSKITFSTLGSMSGTTTTQWIGDAGDKLDKKLAALERKRRGKAVVDPKKVARTWHDWVGKDKLAEIGAKVEKQHRGKAIIDPKKVAAFGKKK